MHIGLIQTLWNFSSEVDVSGQFGEAEILAKLIGDQKGGFFIEAGAYDGEIHSNSLHFEANRVSFYLVNL